VSCSGVCLCVSLFWGGGRGWGWKERQDGRVDWLLVSMPFMHIHNPPNDTHDDHTRTHKFTHAVALCGGQNTRTHSPIYTYTTSRTHTK
jgi:hypothetical protein